MSPRPCSLTRALLAVSLLAFTPTAARADEAVPSLDDQKGATLEVQVLGWSADEQRYALRVYDLTETFGDEEPPPACKGYVDHTGKKFLGGLSFVLYEGSRRVGGWRIQDAKKCTPPETARERLAQAKAALAEKGIDLTATGATLADEASHQQPNPQKKGKKTEYRLTTRLALPQGPGAGQKLEVDAVVVVQELTKKEGGEDMEFMRGQATLRLRVASGKKSTALGEFKLGPNDSEGFEPWIWSAGFDRALLSPSGKVLVPVAYVHHGDMRLNNKPRILMAPVNLAEKLGGASSVSAPTP